MRVCRRNAGDRPGGRFEPGRAGALRGDATRREQHEHPRPGSQRRARRRRHADERRRVRRDRCERERNEPVGRAGLGGRLGHAGSRPDGGQRAGSRRSVEGRAERSEEHEHLRSRAQPRQRRQRLAVEQRRLVRRCRELEPDRPERRPGRLGWNAGDRPGCGQHAVRRRPVRRDAARREQHERSRPGAQHRSTAATSRSRTASIRRQPPRT